MLIQKINACFCLFVGIWPREALPVTTFLRKIQLELAFDFFFFLKYRKCLDFLFLFFYYLGGGGNESLRNIPVVFKLQYLF